jgi:hypothetical protein
MVYYVNTLWIETVFEPVVVLHLTYFCLPLGRDMSYEKGFDECLEEICIVWPAFISRYLVSGLFILFQFICCTGHKM